MSNDIPLMNSRYSAPDPFGVSPRSFQIPGFAMVLILRGMNVAAGPELAAAVSNAGGLGVIGGLGYT
jgi:NAD(P)H-dependent flavin oxidoreductase YrpB (nitropropane dioxygenase family)